MHKGKVLQWRGLENDTQDKYSVILVIGKSLPSLFPWLYLATFLFHNIYNMYVLMSNNLKKKSENIITYVELEL